MALDPRLKPIEAIDKQIAYLWSCYRKWYDHGTESPINIVDALSQIDALLEQRHELHPSQGELQDQRDIARADEWGDGNPTGEGQVA